MSDLVTRATRVLRGSGGRMTAQRRTILEILDQIGGHPTADEIYLAARQKDRSLNASTVYRTLTWLQQVGLLNAAWLGPERSRRQETPGRALPTEHHHFVCTSCGCVIEFAAPDMEELKTEFAVRHGAAVRRATLTLYGVCAKCRAKEER